MDLRRSHDGNSHEKILFDCLVVGKIGDNAGHLLCHEYEVAEMLEVKGVQGIAHYICYFEFNHGGNHVLMMEYVKNKSLGDHQWRSSEKLQSCCKQVVCTMLDAFLKCGLRHGDLHSKNVLIKPSTKASINYQFTPSLQATIPCYGFVTKLMDFELSSLISPPNPSSLFKDLEEFFDSVTNKMVTNIIYASIRPVRDYISELRVANATDPLLVLNLLPIIDSIEVEGCSVI